MRVLWVSFVDAALGYLPMCVAAGGGGVRAGLRTGMQEDKDISAIRHISGSQEGSVSLPTAPKPRGSASLWSPLFPGRGLQEDQARAASTPKGQR